MFPHLHFTAALFLSLFLPAFFTNAEPCSETFSQEAHKRNITGHCMKKTLGAEFGWNYFNNSRKLEILFGAKLDGDVGWLAWGLNPGEQPMMIGTRALIGIQEGKKVSCDKYNITLSTKLHCGLFPSKIELDVLKFSFYHVQPVDMHMIYAVMILPAEYIDSRTNVVWQVGNAVVENQPFMHPVNLEHSDSKETIDLISGSLHSFDHKKLQRLRTVHGILNILGWGTLLPIGTIIARYFRKFPFNWPRWFSLHVSCQIIGYTLGTVGFVLGLLLANASGYYSNFRIHRILGIFVFTFATLQMLALRLKPTRRDEYRTYWNMYHHFLGYALLAMIAVNIFQGIAILSTDRNWKFAYRGILVLLGLIALSLEIFSWIKFCLLPKNSAGSTVSATPPPPSSTHVSTSGTGAGSDEQSHKEDSGSKKPKAGFWNKLNVVDCCRLFRVDPQSGTNVGNPQCDA